MTRCSSRRGAGTITLYHGFPSKIAVPQYGLGNDRHDCGRGSYLTDDAIVKSQGKLFDLVAQRFPGKSTEDFINAYMASKMRKSIDEAQAYVSTMSADEPWGHFVSTEGYQLKDGEALGGFTPDWIGEFYAYYQWRYAIPSA